MVTIKKVTDLVVGDQIRTEDGADVSITEISNGMLRGALLVSWRGGWGHLMRVDSVEIIVAAAAC